MSPNNLSDTFAMSKRRRTTSQRTLTLHAVKRQRAAQGPDSTREGSRSRSVLTASSSSGLRPERQRSVKSEARPNTRLRLRQEAEKDGSVEILSSGESLVVPRAPILSKQEGEGPSVEILSETKGQSKAKGQEVDGAPSQVKVTPPPLVIVDNSSRPRKVFERAEVLGTGGFAQVYSVTERSSGIRYADKVINKDIFSGKKRRQAREKMDREIRIHKMMSHVNIIKFLHSFEDNQFVHLILEQATQRTLLHVSKARVFLTEPEAKYYFSQIAAGTNYIHDQRVLHRDLKLANMLLSANMTVKIADFGLSTTFAENTTSLCGTPNYIAPEVVAKKGHSIESEIWSIGCIVYALLCGKPPFDSESVTSTYTLISAGKYKLPSHLSQNAASFLSTTLSTDPRKRGTLKPGQPFSLLSHPFVTEGIFPTHLPPSAVSEAPELTESEAVPILIESSEDENQGTPGCTPALSISLKLMRGFFNNKTDFLLLVAEHLGVMKSRDNDIVNCVVPSEELSKEVLIPVFISKWLDSKLLGFIFQLSDGAVGLSSEDSTRLGMTSCGKYVEYTDARGKMVKCCTVTGLDENSNAQQYPDLKDKLNKLRPYIRYMNENLRDTLIAEPYVRQVVPVQNVLPHVKTWHRSTDSIGMELSCRTVQVNFLEERTKIMIWDHPDHSDLMVTRIARTDRNRVEAASFSLSSTRNYLTANTRRLLGRVEGKIREMIQ